jgi:chromosome segregation protein
MFVKKLELMGFKTFADKGLVEFGGDVTAIVGPNGSGKSNIVDALLWVLGESNVRNLRGQRVTDVIFNGSEKRRSQGMAEVSLTLDNADRRLPLDFGEITVTRRAFRSGEGEYFINGTRCRLKDIYELFLDTGVGREAYSIITQGEIDAVLSAKPEDRRGLFEEAAGIRKYRYRREEALRKLERTEQNLRRVCDIMSEIGSQVEPLAQQAEQAKRFTELQARLWDIEIGLLIRDLRRFTTGLDEARTTAKDASARIVEHDERLGELEERKSAESVLLAKLEEDVDNARRVQQTLSGNFQRLESRMAVLDERLKSMEAAQGQAKQECASLEIRIKQTGERIGVLEAELVSCQEKEKATLSSAAEMGKSVAEIEKRLELASRSVNERKAGYLEIVKELSSKRSALRHAEARVVELKSALDRYAREIEQLQAQRIQAEDQAQAAAREIESITKRIAELEEAVSTGQAQRQDLEKKTRDLSAERNRIENEVSSKSSRLKTLREMDEARAGFSEGVRGIITAGRQGKLRGQFSILADVIRVAEGYDLAIETALGQAAQDILVPTRECAAAALAYLRDNQAGRATLVAIDGIKAVESQVKGGATIAADLVECEAQFQPAVKALLANTLVTDTLESAFELVDRVTGWDKIVTQQGEIVMPSGAITGGRSKGKAQGLVQRKAEIESLAKETERLKSQVAALDGELSELRSESSRVAAQVQASERALSEQRVALADRRKTVEMNGQVARSFVERIEKAKGQASESEKARSRMQADVDRLSAELKAADQENAQLDETVAAEEGRADQLRKQRDAAREDLARLNVESAGLAERIAALKSSLQDSQRLLAESKSALENRSAQIATLAVDSKTLDDERSAVSQEKATQKDLLDAAVRRLDEVTKARAEMAAKAASTDAQLREATSARGKCSEVAHEAEVRVARLEVQIAQITERLLTEYELTYERAMEWPEEEIEVERGAATEVARLRRELRDMGPVNTGAIQEYERVKERWDFLTAQRTDLENAKAQINEAIRDIDSKTRDLFTDTFNAAAAHFETMFKHLFGGGRAELTLTDPKDPLETGVNICVQPPGKKLQDLALLSGGERALTATALIFALLRVKPSPFVLMDEVDAPLDESNVERFADVIREFADRSQFVVITHNRATMEAANSLYGVTMQEPGVSKLISVKLSSEGPVDRELKAAGVA